MAVSKQKLHEGLAILHHSKSKWGLLDDGDYFLAGNSLLQPVLYERLSVPPGPWPAMLKIPLSNKGEAGFRLLDCWAGKSAVNVYRYDANALLMERAVGERSLRRMVLDGRDEEANTIVCGVVGQLHTHACAQPPDVSPLSAWFQSLTTTATQHGGIFATCLDIADALLLDPQARGWLAIDPKDVIGERGFDYANLFCNPTIEVATSPLRLPRAIPKVAAQANIEPQRLLRWVVAWSGLMAAWMLEDAEDPTLPLSVAELVMMELEIS